MKKIKMFVTVLIAALLCAGTVGYLPVSADAAGTVASVDNTLADTWQNIDDKSVNAPTVVAEVNTSDGLKEISKAVTADSQRPSNVILQFNDDCNIVGTDGEVLGSFANIYGKLKHKVIPILYIRDEAAADSAIKFLTKEGTDILDMAVMSDNAGLVSKIKNADSKIRGIVEYAEEDFYTDGKLDLYNLVATANRNSAMIVVIPQNMATTETVTYLQARFKTVWVRTGETDFELRNAINSGAYGLVASDFAKAYSVLNSYEHNTFMRMPFNVGHRGLNTGDYNENSISCIRAAIAGGATHLEIDAHLTKDNRILIMHDDTLARTTTCGDGSIRIRDLTLQEIRSRYTLLRNNEQIPILEDVLEVLRENKDIVLILELKEGDDIVQRIDALLGKGQGQYDVKDQIVIISFSQKLLADVKNTMPDVPSAFLTYPQAADKDKDAMLRENLIAMGVCNAVLDLNYDGINNTYDRQYLRDRGIMGWYWTFGDSALLLTGLKRGHAGLTNNMATEFGKMAVYLRGKEEVATELSIGSEVALSAVLYNGLTLEVKGKVVDIRVNENDWDVIATCKIGGRQYYTQSFRICKPHTYAQDWSTDETYHWHASTCGHEGIVSEKGEHTFENGVCSVCGYAKQPSPSEPKKGCNSSLTAVWSVCGGLIILCLALGIVLIIKKKSK